MSDIDKVIGAIEVARKRINQRMSFNAHARLGGIVIELRRIEKKHSDEVRLLQQELRKHEQKERQGWLG